MKRRISLCLTATIALIALVSVPAEPAQNTTSIESFWARFKLAVINGNKESTAQLSQFPLQMPYGAPAVKNKIQLIKRYREIFNGEANAAKCFREAQPVIDPSNRKRFTIGCKNAAGDEVVIYGFILTPAGWKFKSLDNLNE